MKNSIELQEKYYDKDKAENFDKKRINSNHFYKVETVEKFFEKYIHNKNKLRIMELGGGTGVHAEHFLKREKERIESFIFSDLSREMLKIAEKRLKAYEQKVKFVCSDAESFDMNIKLDCIYVSGAMHHFENPEKAIENCRKHLAPGGILIICEPIVTNPYGLSKVIFKKEEYGQFRVTYKNVKKWLGSSGFSILDEKYLHYRSNCKFFRWLLKLEKIKMFNWSAVMFCIAARCNESSALSS